MNNTVDIKQSKSRNHKQINVNFGICTELRKNKYQEYLTRRDNKLHDL
jgi:hypothetical protein